MLRSLGFPNSPNPLKHPRSASVQNGSCSGRERVRRRGKVIAISDAAWKTTCKRNQHLLCEDTGANFLLGAAAGATHARDELIDYKLTARLAVLSQVLYCAN